LTPGPRPGALEASAISYQLSAFSKTPSTHPSVLLPRGSAIDRVFSMTTRRDKSAIVTRGRQRL